MRACSYQWGQKVSPKRRIHIPKESNLHTHCREYLKTCIELYIASVTLRCFDLQTFQSFVYIFEWIIVSSWRFHCNNRVTWFLLLFCRREQCCRHSIWTQQVSVQCRSRGERKVQTRDREPHAEEHHGPFKCFWSNNLNFKIFIITSWMFFGDCKLSCWCLFCINWISVQRRRPLNIYILVRVTFIELCKTNCAKINVFKNILLWEQKVKSL
jgi:hypothetical protein